MCRISWTGCRAQIEIRIRLEFKIAQNLWNRVLHSLLTKQSQLGGGKNDSQEERERERERERGRARERASERERKREREKERVRERDRVRKRQR